MLSQRALPLAGFLCPGAENVHADVAALGLEFVEPVVAARHPVVVLLTASLLLPSALPRLRVASHAAWPKKSGLAARLQMPALCLASSDPAREVMSWHAASLNKKMRPHL